MGADLEEDLWDFERDTWRLWKIPFWCQGWEVKYGLRFSVHTLISYFFLGPMHSQGVVNELAGGCDRRWLKDLVSSECWVKNEQWKRETSFFSPWSSSLSFSSTFFQNKNKKPETVLEPKMDFNNTTN